MQFRGRLPGGVTNATNIFFIGLPVDDGSTFTLHGKEEDAGSVENPMAFVELEQSVQIAPVGNRWAHHVYWRGHPLIKGNTVRFAGAVRPTIPRLFSEDDRFYIKAEPGRTNEFGLYSDVGMKPESRVKFADHGVVGNFGIESVNEEDKAEPPPVQDGEDAKGGEAPPAERSNPPRVDLARYVVIWPNHGLKNVNGTEVRFVGAPANWPKGTQSVERETSFFVEPRGSDWVELHSGRGMDETTRVVFAGLPQNGLFALRTVPGEFTLDSPRGDGQSENPELKGQVAAALDRVVGLGGSYALDSETGQVTYVGLVGPLVERDAVREPVLAQLTVLKNLKYMDIWKDPSISRKDWPEYEDKLKAFNQNVPECSISLAVPTTLWVRSLSPAKAEGEDGPKEITQMTLKIRALNLKPYYTIANRDYAMMVVKTINGNPYFGGDPETEEGSALAEGTANPATEDLFFDFEVNLFLPEPLKLEDLGGAGTLADAVTEGKQGAGGASGVGQPQGDKKSF